ncbi:MAG: hypothetical protein JSV53_05335 [candidate division WOR-3 bacterium]|nr:MAG: hypothetical protein JSV53_05335 [candidate division WOR-3 bacterium]
MIETKGRRDERLAYKTVRIAITVISTFIIVIDPQEGGAWLKMTRKKFYP